MRAKEHIEISLDNFSHKNASSKRFVFLDSFRGLCAFCVMFHHAFIYGKIFQIEKQDNNRLSIFINNFFQANLYYSQTLAVNGFFILSSFLLTYRLILDITDSSNQSLIKIMKVVLKFLVRRTFRVYLPFVIYCTVVKIDPMIAGGGFYEYTSWLNLTILNYSGPNHLWTIAPEIKYYFLIPIICLPIYITKFKKTYLFLSIFSLISINVIYIRWNIFESENFEIRDCLPTFLNGSLMAFAFYLLEYYYNLFDLKFKNILVNVLSLCLTFFGIYCNHQ